MLVNGKLVVRTLALVFTVSAAAGAQAACDLDENKIGKSLLQYQLARQAKTPEAQATQYRALVKDLSSKTDNPAERAYLLAQTVGAFMAHPSITTTTVKRADLGFTIDPETVVDPAVLVDSLYRTIEVAKPACVATIAQVRRNEAWAKMVNDAVQAYNAEKVEEAAALAKRSNLLYPGAPFSWNILAGIAQRKNENKEAIAHLKEMAKASANDTSWAEMARNAYGAIGQIALDAAGAAEGADKAAYLAEAKAAFEALSKNPGSTGNYNEVAQSGLARVALLQGDTASIKASYAAALANPSAMSFNQLLEAGTTAARAEQLKDAITLLEAAREKNPWSRDVLNNLTVMYIRTEKGGEALPLALRLTQIDPSNPDNFQLLTLAYAGQQKQYSQLARDLGRRANATTNAARKKALIDSAAAMNGLITKATDNALKNNELHEKMPVKVSFTNFGTGEDGKTNLGGTVMNRSDAEKSYTMIVEFLSAAGEVLATQTATIGPVKPQGTARFSVSANVPNIVAFRYKPLT